MRARRTRRDREGADFEAQARRAFGTGPRVLGVSHATEMTMGQEINEERRLAARHDPARPSGCRLCGQTTEREWTEVAGWKCCAPCVELLPGGLAAVLSELLAMTVEPSEAVELCARIPCRNPAYLLGRWPFDAGQAQRWAHVPADLAERGRHVLRELRAPSTPRTNTYGTGCGWCGISRSTQWTETPWKFGRNGPRVAARAECEPWITRSGARNEGYGEWRTHLLACCVGMSRGQMGLTYDLRAFHESGADPAGTAERWQYLGETWGELRARVIRAHPRLVTLTDRERRLLALERAIAEVERPPERTKLANLGTDGPTGAGAILPPW